MDRTDFYRHALSPEHGDLMRFVVERRLHDDKTFSQEAIVDVSDQISMFLAARVYARWTETGEPVKRMMATISIAWDDDVIDHDELDSQPLPWFHRGDKSPDGWGRIAAYEDLVNALKKERLP